MRYVSVVRQAELESASALDPGAASAAADEGSSATAVPTGGSASALRGGAERVEALDALRGAMALAVAVYHFGVLTRAFSGGLRDAVVLCGLYSVEGFFVISGFCFFHLYGGRRLTGAALLEFQRKRFARIAPLFYCTVALSLALEPAFQSSFSWARLLENLTFTFGLFHPNHAQVIGGWSIGLEYIFYFALPVLLWVGRRPLALCALLIALVLWSLPFAFGKVAAAEQAQRFNVYVQLPNHAFLFVLGALIAEQRRRAALRVPLLAAVSGAFFLCWLAARSQPPFADHFAVLIGGARLRYLATCSAVVLLFAFTRWPDTPLVRPLRHLGALSYSLYLIHPFAWQLLSRLAPSLLSPLPLLATALLLAELTHRTLEPLGTVLLNCNFFHGDGPAKLQSALGGFTGRNRSEDAP